MEYINAPSLRRKSGQWGTRHLLPGQDGRNLREIQAKTPPFPAGAGLSRGNARKFHMAAPQNTQRVSKIFTLNPIAINHLQTYVMAPRCDCLDLGHTRK
jgi:hypothetical protein